MHDIQSNNKTVDHEVQTRIYIRSSNSNRPAIALSNRRCQTIITTEPDQSIQTIRALFQFLPQQEIDKGAIHEIKLPRAALLQWKLPLASYEQIKSEIISSQEELSTTNTVNEIHNSNSNNNNNNNYNITKGVLKKRDSDRKLGEWEALLNLSHPQIMADQLVDQETQTNFTVRPYVLGDEQIAHLVRASSLQTSLTFNPDASITEIQPFLTQDIDHFHTYISTITPKPYVMNSNEEIENLPRQPVIEPTVINRIVKEHSATSENKDSLHKACECPTDIKTKDKSKEDIQYSVISDNKRPKAVEINPTVNEPSDALQNQDAITEQHSVLDEFIDMLLSDLADKSISNDVKDFLLQELAEVTVMPDTDYDINNTKADSNEKKITNQSDDEAFEGVVAQIMNTCVYNIEDQLKRIMETFDTYQKDLKNINKQLDNLPADDTPVPLELPPENQSVGEDASPCAVDMQGDSNLKDQVEVLCECCHLTAGGAAVPVLNESSQIEGRTPVTFDVVLGPDGIEIQNNTKSSPSNGEQIIRFSIVPSHPNVNQQGTNKSNAFEIHVSCPDIPKAILPSDAFGNDLGTGPEYECTVVLPPKKYMRTSEENLNIKGTSQKTGMMFEQNADYIEPYISNVEDDTVPINMLQSSSKPKINKTITRPYQVTENNDCNTSIEVPWEIITLQVTVVEPEKGKYDGGCCTHHVEETCPSKSCPMSIYHKPDRDHSQYTVQFDRKTDDIFFEQESTMDDMDYEPTITPRSVVTPSTSEIHASVSDLFIHEEIDQHERIVRRTRDDSQVYDMKFERHNEPYMDYMYNHFPDDNIDGNCGHGIEIPWELFTLPIGAKIRKVKKPGQKNASTNDNQTSRNGETSINIFNTMNTTNLHLNIINYEQNITTNDLQGIAKQDTISEFGIDMNIAEETISNIVFVDGAAASQKSISHYSMISDFRYLAKRCPKDMAIGFNFADDGTISTIVAGSETFILARNPDVNDISNVTMDIKSFTDCTNKSEQVSFIRAEGEERSAIVSIIGNVLTETQSLSIANSIKLTSSTPANQTQSMPEIPSRGTVTFPNETVVIAKQPSGCKGTNRTTSKSNYSNDPISTALEAYKAEMKPLREALDKLKEEVRQLNLPQVVPNYYGEYSQQYPNLNMPYPGPSVRHTTAVSSGCGIKTSTRMKPLFMQNMVGSQYNQLQYPLSPLPGMPPMPYYLPPQQYPSMPYPVPGMVPYPQPPMNQQPSDLYSHQEYTPISRPSCKSRRGKKRNKETSVVSKDSQFSKKASNSKKNKCCSHSCPNKNEKCGEDVIETHYGPKEIVDESSEVSVKATSDVISNKDRIAPENDLTTTKATDTTHSTSSTHSQSIVPSHCNPPDQDISLDSEEDVTQENPEKASMSDSNNKLPGI